MSEQADKNPTDNAMEEVITLLDVLGWKGIWRRVDNPVKCFDELLVSIKGRRNRLAKWIREYQPNFLLGIEKDDLQLKNLNGSLEQILNLTEIQSLSDTIIIRTPLAVPQQSAKTLSDAVLNCHAFFCASSIPDAIENGMPLRGATAIGKVISNQQKDVFVGPAVDEVASWYEKTDWIGVILCPSAAYRYDWNGGNDFWFNYKKLPLKIETTVNHLPSLVWPLFFHDKEKKSEVINNIKSHFTKMSPIFPEFISKFENTLEYLESFLPADQ